MKFKILQKWELLDPPNGNFGIRGYVWGCLTISKQKKHTQNLKWPNFWRMPHLCNMSNTVCFSTCDTFDQPVRSTKFHQLLVIYDSFCSWMATNLIHNCNFDHNSEGWQWEPLHLRCQNSTILTFYHDLANLRHLNSYFFQIRHCSVINKENFSKLWNDEHTKKS